MAVTPREELMVAAWESRRMLAALTWGDPDAEERVPRLGRLLAVGFLGAGVVVAVRWVT